MFFWARPPTSQDAAQRQPSPARTVPGPAEACRSRPASGPRPGSPQTLEPAPGHLSLRPLRRRRKKQSSPLPPNPPPHRASSRVPSTPSSAPLHLSSSPASASIDLPRTEASRSSSPPPTRVSPTAVASSSPRLSVTRSPFLSLCSLRCMSRALGHVSLHARSRRGVCSNAPSRLEAQLRPRGRQARGSPAADLFVTYPASLLSCRFPTTRTASAPRLSSASRASSTSRAPSSPRSRARSAAPATYLRPRRHSAVQAVSRA